MMIMIAVDTELLPLSRGRYLNVLSRRLTLTGIAERLKIFPLPGVKRCIRAVRVKPRLAVIAVGHVFYPSHNAFLAILPDTSLSKSGGAQIYTLQAVAPQPWSPS